MALRSYLVAAILLVLVFTDAAVVRGDDKGKGSSNGNDNSQGNQNNGNGKGNKDEDKDETDYDVKKGKDGKEYGVCKGKGRKPNCDGYGSLCYDPRFVGGDGVMFYFHGAKGGNFAIVSDKNMQINAHFIGTRPQGRTRDFTWVQALSVMFDTHTLVIAANKVSQWDDKVDALSVRWNGEPVNVPEDEWRTNADGRKVVVERTDEVNSVKVTVYGLETQFKFSKLSDNVEGVLGKTYQPGYVSPVKRGVPMPLMGGEDKYQTPSLFSPLCKACRFERPSGIAMVTSI